MMLRMHNLVVAVVFILHLAAATGIIPIVKGAQNSVASSLLDDIYILCNTQTYESNSAFSEHLSNALSALKQNANSHLYSLQQAGTTMAAYQCRGDLPLDSCSNCVAQAVQTALSSCPSAIGSRVQLDGCFLRYENYSFTVLDTGIVVELCNTQKDDSTAFQGHVSELLSQVTKAAPHSNHLFASATAAFNATTRLYGLAQCLDYLSPTECSYCLDAHSSSWTDCDNAVGAQIHSVSCYYRFEIYPFFYQS